MRCNSQRPNSGQTSLEGQQPTCPLCHGRGVIVNDDTDNAYNTVALELCRCVTLKAQAEYLSPLPRQGSVQKDAPTIPSGNFFIRVDDRTLTSVKKTLLTHWFPQPFRYVVANELKDVYFGGNPGLPSLASLVQGKEPLHILDLFQNLVDPTETARGVDSMLDKILSMYVTHVIKSGRTIWILSLREQNMLAGLTRTSAAIREQRIAIFPVAPEKKE